MLPILELRGSIIYARSLNLNILLSTIIAILGNMIVVPFIFLYSRKIIEYGMKLKYIGKVFEMINKKGHNAGQKLLESTDGSIYYALFLFVAIPLPGTGAWTGTLAATILDLDFKKSIYSVLAGVFLASIIMNVLSIIGFSIF